jgi:hypothetical protein
VSNESQQAMAVAAEAGPMNVTVVRYRPSEGSLVIEPVLRDGCLDDVPHLVFVGSLESQDGVDELPEASICSSRTLQPRRDVSDRGLVRVQRVHGGARFRDLRGSTRRPHPLRIRGMRRVPVATGET